MAQVLFWAASSLLASGKNSKKNIYPNMPQTGTGKVRNMEYGLCETVSQFMALEMAQKLLYPMSVYTR
jgi:hypothetical protein